jgi:hypothetical protein
MPNATSMQDMKKRVAEAAKPRHDPSFSSLPLRGIGDEWHVGDPPHPLVGTSYMMASAPAGGQTYTAQNLGIK